MKGLFRLGLLLGLAALPAAPAGLSGCHILIDAAYRDAQQAKNIPQAIAEGAVKDVKQYQRVR